MVKLVTKVVICGMKGVGKTAILEQAIYGKITKDTVLHSTLEDIYCADVLTDRGTYEKMQFFDCAGVEPPLSGPPQSPTMQLTTNQVLPRLYISFAEGYIMVYDTSKPESLDVLMYLKKDIDRQKEKKEVAYVVLGNRMAPDDVTTLEKPIAKAITWCQREKIPHYEVNVLDRQTLDDPIVYLASKLNPVQTKSAFQQLSTLGKLAQKNMKADNN